ncbi:hypothetical protein OHD16_06795 [Sphingobacterium sp. ML3W]|uniref:hypothetical protein n=1 Tax=Sphingobacterium sp. ML3W TaxID=1538644 RepID=UPI00249BF97C|nr:hypothetical protein [Sphingobacterium sp. ML3W]WFA79677.1 hypothetical protein OGI71_27035 [Sphingobacterium sp. ML3W]
MTREQVLDYICLGYNVLENGRPIFVQEVFEYLQELDEEETGVFVLEDLLTWNQKELDMIEGQKYYDEVGEYGRKLFLRNEAIRFGKWDKYEAFLSSELPDIATSELEEAQDVAGRVKQMTKDELRAWIDRNRVNMLTSDLYVLDVGSILCGSIVPTGDLQFIIGDGLEDLIECNVSPMDVLNLTDHVVYWVDPVVKT